jgi:hypothetical protein
MAPSKPTAVDIDALKAALSELRDLKARMGGGSGGAYARLADAADISADLGPLLDGAGPQMAAYYSSHASAIRIALLKAGTGVAAAEAMLELTIRNHETTDQHNVTAANDTATGGGGVTTSRGLG